MPCRLVVAADAKLTRCAEIWWSPKVPGILNADADIATINPGQSKSAGVVKLMMAITARGKGVCSWPSSGLRQPE
jgi:hypothetical protein